MDELIIGLIELTRKAGIAILDMYYKSSQFQVQAKADATPLTQADLLANEILVTGLQQLTPNLPILSEESAIPEFPERQQWQRFWLIDPVDGTKEFIRHSGEFSINIALIEQHKPILGFIYLPVLELAYYAIHKTGAYKLQQQPERLHVRSLKKNESVTIASGHRHNLEKLQPFLQHLPSYKILNVGSAYKFCLIAEGTADFYPRIGPTSEWDTAAGQIILEEAGGKVLDLEFQPLRYNTKASLLNPHFIALGDTEKLISYLKSRRKSWQKRQLK